MPDFKGNDSLSTLDDNCRYLYSKKLKLADNSQLPNPYDLCGWKNEVSLSPDISWRDIYNYLINHPSGVFINRSLKAYKSLDACNYLVSGHVQKVYYHDTEKYCKFCFIKSEVGTLCSWGRYILPSFLAK